MVLLWTHSGAWPQSAKNVEWQRGAFGHKTQIWNLCLDKSIKIKISNKFIKNVESYTIKTIKSKNNCYVLISQIYGPHELVGMPCLLRPNQLYLVRERVALVWSYFWPVSHFE